MSLSFRGRGNAKPAYFAISFEDFVKEKKKVVSR
jgi:hypothetical protein